MEYLRDNVEGEDRGWSLNLLKAQVYIDDMTGLYYYGRCCRVMIPAQWSFPPPVSA